MNKQLAEVREQTISDRETVKWWSYLQGEQKPIMYLPSEMGISVKQLPLNYSYLL